MSVQLAPEVLVYLEVRKKIEYSSVLSLLKFEPHKNQKLILDTFFDGDFSVMTITAGRRFGKTLVISAIATTELLVPNASILLITPSFATAQTMFENIERNILMLGIKVTSKNSKALTFTLENRATIFVVTTKSYTNALGRKFSLLIGDETQDITDIVDIFENYLNPAMADFGVDEREHANAKAIFIGTARDETNDFFDLVKRTKSNKHRGYVNFVFKTEDNPYIPKSFIEQKKRELDPITFGREYEGKWSKGVGERIYYVFDEEKHVIPIAEVLKYKPLGGGIFIVAIDVGFTDNTGYLLAYKQPLTGRLVIFAEYKASEMPMSHHVGEFKAIEAMNVPQGTHVQRYIDPSAAQVSNDLAVDHHYYTFPAFNSIDEGVKLVNTAFYKGDLVISEECVDLIDEIDNLVWLNPATKTVKKSKTHKHFDLSLSTMRYLVATDKVQSDMNILAV